MDQEVRRYMEEHRLATPGEALWVAVSGGVDSMVLLHLLRALGHPCHVAHVDHGLRGAESNADREFVRTYCAEHGIPFAHRRVDVWEQQDGRSVQMAARELRYAWFHGLVQRGPAQLALAHHADDAIETLLIHLVQGMGTKGWGAIPVRSGPFIRPLLGVSRTSILAYAQESGVPFREDASNTDPKYLRNRVRREVLPLLEDLRAGARDVLSRNVDLLRELSVAAGHHLDAVVARIEADDLGRLHIPFELLSASGAPHAVLTRLLRAKEFHPDRIGDIVRAVREGRTGARFVEGDQEVWVEREQLIIGAAPVPPPEWTIASAEQWPADAPLSIGACTGLDIDPKAGAEVAWLDADAAPFPWVLRPWRMGDRMRPRGLGGSKLVSDILIDAKVSREAKRRTYVLESAGTILWCCGLRRSQDGAASSGSERVWRCTWSGA
jgi:tRNA(Ile)-lysidine synthase